SVRKVAKEFPTVFVPVLQRFIDLPGLLFGSHEPWERNLLFAAALASMALFGLERWRRSRELPAEPRSVRETLLHVRYEIIIGVLFALFVVSPLAANGATLIFHRFLTPMFALLAIVLSPPKGRPERRTLAPLLATFVSVGTIFVALPPMIDFRTV